MSRPNQTVLLVLYTSVTLSRYTFLHWPIMHLLFANINLLFINYLILLYNMILWSWFAKTSLKNVHVYIYQCIFKGKLNEGTSPLGFLSRKKSYYPASNFGHITPSILQRPLGIHSMELKRNDMYTTDGTLIKIIELWRYWIEEKQMM